MRFREMVVEATLPGLTPPTNSTPLCEIISPLRRLTLTPYSGLLNSDGIVTAYGSPERTLPAKLSQCWKSRR